MGSLDTTAGRHGRGSPARYYDTEHRTPDAAFDDLTALARLLCRTDVALLTLGDGERHWVRSAIGLDEGRLPCALSLGAAVVRDAGLSEVEDTRTAPSVADNALCRGADALRFCAGHGIETADGTVIGALLVADRGPRRLLPAEREGLAALSRQTARLVELRRLEACARRLESEVNHRVKNSLFLISGLLSIQASAIRHPEAAREIGEAKTRIGIVARMHEQLQRGDETGYKALPLMLSRLIEDLRALIEPRISLRCAVDATGADGPGADPSAALSMTLIAHELVLNAAKHAFPDGRIGTISLRLERQEAATTLIVEDDGEGRPGAGDGSASGFGTRLISVMAAELGAEVAYGRSSKGGTRAEIRLPH